MAFKDSDLDALLDEASGPKSRTDRPPASSER
jgi:hypothetical protein